MKTVTSKQKKIRKAIIQALIIVGSFLAGLVSDKNKEAGQLIKDVITTVVPAVLANPSDSLSIN